MTGRAHATLTAGKGNKKFMGAVWTSNPCKSFMDITALEKFGYGVTNNRSPEAIFLLIAFRINTFKFVIILLDNLIKR